MLTAHSPLPCRVWEGMGSINTCKFGDVGGHGSLGVSGLNIGFPLTGDGTSVHRALGEGADRNGWSKISGPYMDPSGASMKPKLMYVANLDPLIGSAKVTQVFQPHRILLNWYNVL